MKQRALRATALAAIAFTFIIACRAQHPAASEIQPQPGGTLTIGHNEDLTDINPFFTHSSFSALLLDLVFDKLINVDPGGQIENQLVDRLILSADQRQWLFHIKSDVRFHDGAPLTAKDVLYSLEILRKHDNLFTSVFDNIESIAQASDDSFSVTLKKPDQVFPYLLRRIYVAPSHVYDEKGYPRGGALPLGSGPFKIAKFGKKEAVLAKNADYFSSPPYLESIRVQVTENNSVALSRLISGQVDFQAFFDLNHYPAVKNLEHIRESRSSNQILLGVFFNNAREAFKSPQVRLALNHAVQRESLIQKGLEGQGQPAFGVVTPQSPAYDPQLPPYEYDLQKALGLLSSAGWNLNGDGRLVNGKTRKQFEFTLLLPQGELIPDKILQMILSDFGRIGIAAHVEMLPMDELLNRVFMKRDYDAALIHYSSSLDLLSSTIFWRTHDDNPFNFTNYHNLRAATHLEEARFAADREKSELNYRFFQQELYFDPPLLYLAWIHYPVFYNHKVHGIDGNTFQNFHRMRNVWISSHETSN